MSSGSQSFPINGSSALQSLNLPDRLAQSRSRERSPREKLSFAATAWQELTVEIILETVCDESPRVIASALTMLPRDKAISVLKKLPIGARQCSLREMACLEKSSDTSRAALLSELTAKSVRISREKSRRQSSEMRLVNILRQCETDQQNVCVRQLTDEDEELAMGVNCRLFRFADLPHRPSQDIRALIRNLPLDVLANSLQRCDSPVLDAVLKCLTIHGRQRLLDEIDYHRAASDSQVAAAQRTVATVAYRLGL